MDDQNIEKQRLEMQKQARDVLFAQSEYEPLEAKPEDELGDLFTERTSTLVKNSRNPNQKYDTKVSQEKLKTEDTLKHLDSHKNLNKMDFIDYENNKTK